MRRKHWTQQEETAILRFRDALSKKFTVIDIRVFGSKVRGNATADSDIDIMVELEEYSPRVETVVDDLIFEINLEYNCILSVIVFSRKELEEGPLSESPIYKVIRKEGVKV